MIGYSWLARFFILLICLGCACALPAHASASIERLDYETKSYFDVTVSEVTVSSVVILHSKGLSQLELRKLSPDWQEYFGYEASKDIEYRQIQKQSLARRISASKSRESPKRSVATGALMRKFGMAPEIEREVDFRGRYSELELGARSQGMRPSCSVFAVVGALEYMLSDASGSAEKLSEEYLIWAVIKTLGQDSYQESESRSGDAGFTLTEVAQAMKAYGVPLRTEMPYAMTSGMDRKQTPSPDIVARARTRSNVAFYHIPGRDPERQIENIIHAINENVPVVIGVKWPHYKTLRHTALISGQKPRDDYSHAVTLIGYRNGAGAQEDTTFIFRNSWGRQWGSGGYGFVRYSYLKENMHSAIFLEINRD